MKIEHSNTGLTRRAFLTKTTLLSSAAALSGGATLSGLAQGTALPVVIFSKVYQSLKLGYEDAAALTAEAGLDGIDCPVRPGGEVLPEQVVDELPRYCEALRRKNLSLPLITSGITTTATPQAERVLRTAKKLGVQSYRLGSVHHQSGVSLEKQLRETKAALKDLAAMNREIGIGAIFQNHSPSGRKYLGGDLTEMWELVGGFEPAQIGVAFDIGHALVVHGDQWREHFDRLRSHLRIAYVKDVKRGGQWVALGQGDIHQTGYFQLLKELKYHAPVSLHVEYDWDDKGKSQTRSVLLRKLKDDLSVLRRWLSQ